MKILAFDTATEACSAALLIDDSIVERFEIAPRAHARLLLPMLDSLLVEADLRLADLDAIAFGRGPGSFTGLRIAASVAQGIACGAGLPVVPISSLTALARAALQASTAPQVLAAIDARMDEIYWAAYARDAQNEPIQLVAEQVASASQLCVPEGGDEWYGIGSGWASDAAVLRSQFAERLVGVDPTALPHAAQIAQLAVLDFVAGKAVGAEQALPVYIRNQVAQRPTGKAP